MPQMAVVLGYRAYEPKEPGTYDYYLEIFSFATTCLSIFEKMTAFAWSRYRNAKGKYDPRDLVDAAPLMFAQLLFLYTVPLIGVFVAAFLIPTNAGLTFTALGLALMPHISIFGLSPLACCICCCVSCVTCDPEKGCCGLKHYFNIMQPYRFFEILDIHFVTPVSYVIDILGEKFKRLVQPCLDCLMRCFRKCFPKKEVI
jgi:hypothetical protein